MIRKVVIIDESDWNRLTFEIARAILDRYDRGGVRLADDNGRVIDDLAEMAGSLLLPISHAIDRLTKGDA